jgi:glycosyltransferase involved in cell wall biosynthesis
MKITYLYQFFTTPKWPGATRAYEFARRLVKRGHEVQMVTSNSGWTGMKLKDAEPAPVGLTVEDGIVVNWLNVGYSNKMGFVRRVIAFLLFSVRAGVKAVRLQSDVIFATSPPLTIGIPAVIAAALKRKPLVFEVRDRWPEAAIQLGVVKNRILIAAAEWLERFIYSRADLIIALTPGIRDEIIKTGIRPEMVSVIPNSCDLELFDNPAAPLLRESPYDFGGKIVLTYCGVHGPANGLDFVLDCAKACAERNLDAVLFLLVGDGKMKPRLIERTEREEIRNVVFWDPIAKTEIPRLMAASDAGLTIFDDLPILRTCSPNKFFDCLAAGRPVFTNMTGWLRELIETNGAGFFIDPSNPTTISNGIDMIVKNRNEWRTCCRNARRLGEAQFSRDILAEKMESAISDIVEQRRTK